MKTTTLVVLGALTAAGCGQRPPPARSVAELDSADWEVRRAAADDLRHIGPPSSTVPHLIVALGREKNAYTYGALLLAVGQSGASDALPYICGGVYAEDADMRRWGKKALELWSSKHGGAGCPPPGGRVAAPFPGAPPASAAAAGGPPAPPDWGP